MANGLCRTVRAATAVWLGAENRRLGYGELVRDRVALVCILRTHNAIFNSGLYNDTQNSSAVLTAWRMQRWGGVLHLIAF